MKHEELSYHVKYYGIKLGVSLVLALLMKQISEELGITLSKTPIQFETKWDSVENVLVINTKGGQK